jgi:hypothetical protein
MQALGSYKGGKMLFLGLGTGLGTAMIVDGIVEPMELGHLPYKKATFEDYIGIRGLDKYGKKKWRSFVTDVVRRLVAESRRNRINLRPKGISTSNEGRRRTAQRHSGCLSRERGYDCVRNATSAKLVRAFARTVSLARHAARTEDRLGQTAMLC